MTELAVPDTIPDNIMEIGVSELTTEGISGDLPCEADKHFWGSCKSNGEKPATWMLSHQGGEPKCTVLLCEDCVAHLQHWIAQCVVSHGPYGFSCRLCNSGFFHYREFTMREL